MPKNSLSVLVVASEVSPLAQTGGLAEVTGSLPLALRDAGVNVAVALPAYRQVLENGNQYEMRVRDIPVRVGGAHLSADILSGELAPGIPAFFVQRDELFDRSGLYGGRQGEYFDNPERYIFFSRVIPAMCAAVGYVPDVIMGNDWQTGLIMPLLDLGALPRTAGVFAVHNQGYLGLVPPERTTSIGLPDRYYTMNGLEYFGQMSLLKAGIVYAQTVTTVSPTYAREVQTPEGGHGLDGVMRAISDKLQGILNGVDYTVWNPAKDAMISAGYSPKDLSGKKACKKALLKRMNLDHLIDRPVIGMVTRLSAQKGLNLLAEAAEELFKLDLGLVVLGSGEPWNEDMMRQVQARYPDRMGLTIGYDRQLSHEIIAGSDMFLMPSMYEPCGLAQMYSLKYGTVPIVRATGGLNDTVRDSRNNKGYPNDSTGFKFNRFLAQAMVRAVRRSVEAFKDREAWRAMMLRGMAEDFSWDRSAREYIGVFENALEKRRSR
jgi:starch synthase